MTGMNGHKFVCYGECNFRSFHSAIIEDFGLLGCDAVSSCKLLKTFLLNGGNRVPNDVASRSRRPESRITDTSRVTCHIVGIVFGIPNECLAVGCTSEDSPQLSSPWKTVTSKDC